VPAADLSQLTAVISTTDRPKSLRRLTRSLRRYLPQVSVLVADQSQQPATRLKIDTIRLPAGAGRGAGCNALLARVRTRYFLMLDDRCELHRDAQVDRLLQRVADDELDVAAGELVGCDRRLWLFVRRRPQSEHGLLEFSGDALTLRPGHRSIGDGFLWCDLVHNFYVARTDKVRSMGGWDPELMNDQREEFFVRAHRHGLRVGIVPEVNAWLWHERREMQGSAPTADCRSLAVAKMGLARMTDLEGHVVKAPRRVVAA